MIGMSRRLHPARCLIGDEMAIKRVRTAHRRCRHRGFRIGCKRSDKIGNHEIGGERRIALKVDDDRGDLSQHADSRRAALGAVAAALRSHDHLSAKV